MAIRKSKQAFQLTALDLAQLNDAMQRIQNELDRLTGLHGPILFYDSIRYADDAGNIVHSWGIKP